MIERSGTRCAGELIRLAVAGIIALLAPQWAVAQTTPQQPIEWFFCLTPAAFDDSQCAPVAVTLPHRFEVPQSGPTMGLYRAEVPRPAPGSYLLSLQRLSLDGAVRIDGRSIIDTLDPQHLSRQRYWPQAGRFTIDSISSERMIIEVAVRGLPQTKNGLGGATLTDLATGENRHRADLILEVVLVAALAAAALIAGIVGLTISGDRGRSAQVLSVTASLAILAALRCAHNLVTHPPVDMLSWHLLGLWLLALISLQAMHVVLAYLMPKRRWSPTFAIAAIAIGLLLFATANSTAHPLIVDGLFTVVTCAALGLFVALIRHALRERDTLGIAIVLSFLAILLTGLHDLLLHFGSASLSDRYLQTWSTPAVVILAIVALAKRAAGRRDLERALQQATLRREDLLRELHDRVGSRLVALAFHTQQHNDDPLLVEEIKALINEVRMIQSAVGSEPTTLEALLADLRHLYSRVGGGRLPLRWDLFELPSPLQLSADQAISVVRIVEEAVANALKHASPSLIVIRLAPGADDSAITLDITDDGDGEFRPASSGGLNNMQRRAQQTGLIVEFLRREQTKTVRIFFTAKHDTRSRLSRWWRAANWWSTSR